MLQTYTARTTEIEVVAEHIYRYVFTLENKATLNFVPGQYILLNIPGGYRQYSISSAPQNGGFVETVVDVRPMGPGSKYLLSLKIDDQVTFRAPLGVFVLQKTSLPKFFLATGTGIAPLKSMALDLAARNFTDDFHLLWGLRNHQDVYFKRLFEELDTRIPTFHHHFCFSQDEPRDNTELSGRIPEALRTLWIDNTLLSNYEWYICGRPDTVDSIRQALLQDFGIKQDHIFNEKFT